MKSQYEEEGELPLFDEVAVDRLMQAIQMVEFGQAVKLGDGLQVTYHVAGHIAGAAMLVLESSEGTLVMSGDVSKSPQRTVEAVRVPRIKADALVLESTYGNRAHANREAEERRLVETLVRITESGGRVLIPAFALGRAQEILQILLAYRDRLRVPVYVDGMVRAVCSAYARFADVLPAATVRAAGEEALFFRHLVKPVLTAQQRSDIATTSAPCIIVASSGMLTGGASQYYARYVAEDPMSAILLTGYQDEEAPGRFLQKLMKERSEGDEPLLRLGKETVKVRCQIDTYSLSAHADKDELVSIAQAFKAGEVLLVHGDAAARHSLASELRQRQIAVTSPRTGTTREFAFRERPWAAGSGLISGQETTAVVLEKLWELLQAQAGNFYSTRELAQVWWGDGEQAGAMQAALQHPDNIFFTSDWRSQSTYRVKSADEVRRTRRQRQIMLSYPDLVGRLVVLRNSNQQPRVGVVKAADIESFEADVQDARGTHYPADALLWVIGAWQGFPGVEGSQRTQLGALIKEARGHMEALLPLARRQTLVSLGKAIQPETLLPDVLPAGVSEQVALTAIVLALAADGASLEADGLLPRRALEHGPLEQNEARALATALFPPAARLRKVGMEVHRKRLTLHFDFPQSVLRQYGDLLETLTEQTGWEAEVRPTVNQQALALAVSELLPAETRILKGPSIFMDKRQVQVELTPLAADQQAEIEQRFVALTDFRLIVAGSRSSAVQPAGSSKPAAGGRMEINSAYAVIRQALEQHGVYKVSLKQDQIVLSFISPQVGERFREQIAALAQQTGYVLSIHPHPNQQHILLVARQLMEAAGWSIRKGPGIHIERGLVEVRLSEAPGAASYEQVNAALVAQTGYQLSVEIQG
jgi:Cft2 family RNA processing exonuclease